jgi:hypothetical protein
MGWGIGKQHDATAVACQRRFHFGTDMERKHRQSARRRKQSENDRRHRRNQNDAQYQVGRADIDRIEHYQKQAHRGLLLFRGFDKRVSAVKPSEILSKRNIVCDGTGWVVRILQRRKRVSDRTVEVLHDNKTVERK